MTISAHLPVITALAAFPLMIMSIKLTLAIVKLRYALRVTLGDEGHEPLMQAIRLHGNFSEHVPFSLLLLALAEMIGVWWPLVLLSAICLVLARFFHMRTFVDGQHNLTARRWGMQLNLASMVLSAGLAVFYALWQLSLGISL